MGQGVCRESPHQATGDCRGTETAAALARLDQKNQQQHKRNKKTTLGSLEMDGNSLFPTQLDRGVSQSVSVLSSAPLSAVTGLIQFPRPLLGVCSSFSCVLDKIQCLEPRARLCPGLRSPQGVTAKAPAFACRLIQSPCVHCPCRCGSSCCPEFLVTVHSVLF